MNNSKKRENVVKVWEITGKFSLIR